MADLGANSLDIVEIVSNTMRDLKIKIPRDELAKINTMNGLVEKMTEVKKRFLTPSFQAPYLSSLLI